MFCDVVAAVRCALERVESGGMKAAATFGEAYGGESTRGLALSLMDAREIHRVVLMMEQRFHVALMARVMSGSLLYLEGSFKELTSFVAHYGQEGDLNALRFGSEGIAYWVRYWLTGMGSFREFGREFGIDGQTAATFYREHIEVLLEGWLAAGRGVVEPILLRQMEEDALNVA